MCDSRTVLPDACLFVGSLLLLLFLQTGDALRPTDVNLGLSIRNADDRGLQFEPLHKVSIRTIGVESNTLISKP